jgi:CRP-like cAMP-binding protein
MPASSNSTHECQNRLLAMLPVEEYQSLQPCLELIDSPAKHTVGKRDQPIEFIYFPCTSVFSVLAVMQDGGAVEVGTIGNEGFVGIDALIGGNHALETTVCQVSGKSLRMPIAHFRQAVNGDTPLRHILQRFLQAYLSLVSQSVACNRLHTIEERFGRWLLMTHDRVKGNEFHLTQEFLGIMLGVHRPSISLVAGAFQQAGLIRYSRGHMTILNREALEEASCECYSIVKSQFERSLGPFRA